MKKGVVVLCSLLLFICRSSNYVYGKAQGNVMRGDPHMPSRKKSHVESPPSGSFLNPMQNENTCVLDYTFIVEESNKTGALEWDKVVIPFVTGTVDRLNVSEAGNHVGVMFFSNTFRDIVKFGSAPSSDKSLLISVINQYKNSSTQGQGTYQVEALKRGLKEYTEDPNGRSVPKVTVLFTVGNETKDLGYAALSEVHTLYKEKNVSLLVVGVKGASVDLLNLLVGCEKAALDCPFVFSGSVLQLNSFIPKILYKIDEEKRCGKSDDMKRATDQDCAMEECFCKEQYDVSLVIDESSSVGKTNWKHIVIPFATSIVDKMAIGEKQVHMEVLFFSNVIRNIVHFGDKSSYTKASLVAKLHSYEDEFANGSGTYIVDALTQVLENSDKSTAGVLRRASHVTILFTDGDENRLIGKEPLVQIHESFIKKHIRLLVVGVSPASTEKLYLLGGCTDVSGACPDVIVSSFDNLQGVVSPLMHTICASHGEADSADKGRSAKRENEEPEEPVDPIEPEEPEEPTEECSGEECYCKSIYDLTLLLEINPYIFESSWTNFLVPFWVNLISNLEVEQNKVHVGVMFYSDKYDDVSQFGEALSYDKAGLVAKIGERPYFEPFEETLRMVDALDRGLTVYSEHEKSRNVPKLTILYTEGAGVYSTTNAEAMDVGLKYRDRNVKLLLVGLDMPRTAFKLRLVGGCLSRDEDCPYFMPVRYFGLPDRAPEVIEQICGTAAPPEEEDPEEEDPEEEDPEEDPEDGPVKHIKNDEPQVECEGDKCLCEDIFDITLVIDESASIKLERWQQQVIPFTVGVLKNLAIEEKKVHVGIMFFAKKFRDIVKFDDPMRYRKDDLIQLVETYTDKYASGGGTYIIDALKQALKKYSEYKNNRKVPKVTVLFTDGDENRIKGDKAIVEVNKLYQQKNVKLLVVGVDPATTKKLNLLGGCDANVVYCPYVLSVNFDALQSIVGVLTEKICKTDPNPPGPVDPVVCSGEKCYCDDLYDITFVIDESPRVGADSWNQQVKPFLAGVVEQLSVEVSKIHVGIMFFATSTRDFVRFGDSVSYDKDQLIAKIQAEPKNVLAESDAFLIDALEKAIGEYTEDQNSRQVAKVTVVFTGGDDSKLDGNESFINTHKVYNEKHIKLLVVGVPPATAGKLNLLGGCAETDVDCPFSISTSYEELESVVMSIVLKVCEKTDTPVVPDPVVPDPEECVGEKCFCEDMYDITLVIDESCSIGLDRWKNQVIPFTVGVLDNLAIEEKKVHVGIMFFSDNFRDIVRFGQPLSYTKADLTTVVTSYENMYAKGNGTYIVDALYRSIAEYSEDKNSRPNVPKATILFTDGDENKVNGNDALINVNKQHQEKGIRLLVVGVGNASPGKLNLLAGCDKEAPKCVYLVQVDFDELAAIASKLTDKICDLQVDPVDPDPEECVGEKCFCEDVFDITLVIDESISIKKKRWSKQVIPFTVGIVENLAVAEKKVHVGIMFFSNKFRDIVRFGQPVSYTKNDLTALIKSYEKNYKGGGGTHIVDALSRAITEYSEDKNSRSTVPKATILFTDGDENKARGDDALINVNKKYQEKNIRLLVVGVGSASKKKLNLLAGCAKNDNKCVYVIQVDFEALADISGKLTDKICDLQVDPVDPDPEECVGEDCFCANVFDLTLVIDESISIQKTRWKKQVIPFTVGIIENLDIAETKVHVGVMFFSNKFRDIVRFGEPVSYTKNDLTGLIKSYEKNYKGGGGTHIVEALSRAITEYSEAKDSRSTVPKATILFTDGDENKARGDDALINVNKKYQEKNIRLFVVGVGSASKKKLNLLAGCDKKDPKCVYVIQVDFDALVDISSRLAEKLCDLEIDPVIPDPVDCVGEECLCEDMFDITLVIDESTSIGLDRWKSQVIPFTTGIIENLAVEKEKVHVGIMFFSHNFRDMVRFGEPVSYTKPDLLAQVQSYENDYEGGGTSIIDAMYRAISEYSEDKNSRSTVPKVTVLFTDGDDSRYVHEDRNLVAIHKAYTKKEIKLLVVGVVGASKGRLNLIAGCALDAADCAHVIYVDFTELPSISGMLTDKICGNIDEPVIPDPNPDPDPEECVGEECFCANVFDLTLVIDESISIKKPRWKKQVIPFTVGIVENLAVEETQVHVGIMFFSNKFRDIVRFGQPVSYTKNDLMVLIKSYEKDYRGGGGTHIVDALSRAITEYSEDKNSRSAVPKATILFTDGDENKARGDDALINVNKLYQEKNIRLFVVGVGSASKKKLNLLAGCAKNDRTCVFVIQVDFDALADISSKLAQKLCDLEIDPVIPDPVECVGEQCLCEDVYDITLLIDESNSIDKDQWKNQVIPFTVGIIENLVVEANKVHVGIMFFSHDFRDMVRFGQPVSYTKPDLLAQVQSYENDHRGGGTSIVEALYKSITDYSEDTNSRSAVPKVTVLFTDGDDNSALHEDKSLIEVHAAYAKKEIKLLVVGVGEASLNKLNLLAGCAPEDSNCAYVLKVDFIELPSISGILTEKICGTIEPVIPDPEECVGEQCLCEDVYDITLVIDESYSIEKEHWKKEVIPFTMGIIDNLAVEEKKVHVGIMFFSNTCRDIVRFGQPVSYTKTDLLALVKSYEDDYAAGGTSIVESLYRAITEYSEDTNSRSAVPKVTILFTDGDDTNPDDNDQGLIEAHAAYTKKEIKLLVVGVGAASKDKLNLLAGCAPEDSNCAYVIYVDFNELPSISGILTDKICGTIEPVIPDPEECVGEECFCEDLYDLTIVLDESGSIGSDHWKKEVIPFTMGIIDNLAVEEKKVHVGMVFFGTFFRPMVRFGEPVSYTKTDLLALVQSFENDYQGGGTRIVDTLYRAITDYSEDKNSRSTVPKVTILFTDGNDSDPQNDDKSLIEVHAAYAKKEIKLLVVGVSEASQDKLNLLAGCAPEDSDCAHVLKVDMIDLPSISGILTDKICGNIDEPVIPDPEECVGEECFCEDLYDLTIVLDESDSIEIDHWRKEVIPFTVGIIDHLAVEEKKVHVGIMFFSTSFRDIVRFGQPESYTKSDLVPLVMSYENKYMGGGTNIVDSLYRAITEYSEDTNSRSTVPKVTILFTDGDDSNSQYDNNSLIEVHAAYAKKEIKLLVVGVGEASKDKLNLLAGCAPEDSNCAHVLKVDMIELPSISGVLADKICGNIDEPVIPDPEECVGEECFCTGVFDVTLVIDESGSIGIQNWKAQVIPFTEAIVESLVVAKDKVHVGVIFFSKAVRNIVQFGDALSTDKPALVEKIRSYRNDYGKGSETYLVECLEGAIQNYSESPLSRSNVPKVTIAFTDGEETGHPGMLSLQHVSQQYKEKNIKLLLVGVGAATLQSLNALGGCKGSDANCPYVIHSNFEDLQNIVPMLTDKICNTSPPDIEKICENPLNLAILLDQSAQITLEQWEKHVKVLATRIVEQNKVEKRGTHITVMPMKPSGAPLWKLGSRTSYDKSEIVRQISGLLKYDVHKKHVPEYLRTLRETVFDKMQNTKRKVILMFVEGKSSADEEELRIELELLRISGIELFVFALDNIDEKEYKLYGNCVVDGTVCKNVTKLSWSELELSVTDHMDHICTYGPYHALCNEWGEWSACPTDTCDVVAMSRRERLMPYTLVPEAAEGSLIGTTCEEQGVIEYRVCNTDPCDEVCGEFGEWTECSVTCGEGIRMKYRDLSTLNLPQCAHLNKVIVEVCSNPACDITNECDQVGEWSEWSECSKTCGYSTRTRTFEIPQSILEQYPNCQEYSRTDVEVCDVPLCTHEEELPCFEWSEWSEWSATCGEVTRRQYAILTPGAGAHCEPSYADKTERIELEECDISHCGEWSEWSECDKTCDNGVRVRHFISKYQETIRASTQDFEECEELFDAVETETCLDLPLCNEEDSCDEWELWLDCPAVVCDNAHNRIYTRRHDLVQHPVEHPAEVCRSLPFFKEEPCELSGDSFCLDAVCSLWEEWGPCSATCGESYRIRERMLPLELQPPKENPDGTVGLSCEAQGLLLEEREVCDVPKECGVVVDPNGGDDPENEEKKEGGGGGGRSTAEKVSMAAGGLLLLGAVAGAAYVYNAATGGVTPDTSNMEFATDDAQAGDVNESGEEFNVVDPDDPSWN